VKKILIVDDHPDMRRLLSITLSRDYEIIEARDGTEALAAVRAQTPDAVLLDIMMPGELDGLQVLEAIKSDPLLKQTLVVMVSARAQAADYRKGQDLGADAYFVKPFHPLELVKWVRERLV
jgi:DNA-binding response OmpR family regulator